MSDDPFERFERSRIGLLIPVALFLIGAVPTGLAIGALDPLVSVNHDADDGAEGDPAAELETPAAGRAEAQMDAEDPQP